LIDGDARRRAVQLAESCDIVRERAGRSDSEEERMEDEPDRFRGVTARSFVFSGMLEKMGPAGKWLLSKCHDQDWLHSKLLITAHWQYNVVIDLLAFFF
jgi:hypothetical protein